MLRINFKGKLQLFFVVLLNRNPNESIDDLYAQVNRKEAPVKR